MNLVLSGAVEIPACFICMFAVERYVFRLSLQKGLCSYYLFLLILDNS